MPVTESEILNGGGKVSFTQMLFHQLIDPDVPKETELHQSHWALAGDPAAHLEFTNIPDKTTLAAVWHDVDRLYMLCALDGLSAYQNQQQLKLINRLMLLKSVGYSDSPTLMDRLLTTVPIMRAGERQQRPDNGFYAQIAEYLTNMRS